jgi:soluble lytic murein transglycosylase
MVSSLKQLYRMKRLLCALVLASSLPALHAANGDERVLAAKDAVQRGDRARLAKQLEAVRGHELEPYVEYWLLRLRLEEAGSDEVRDFLARQSGSYLADKLRGEWLKVLGKRREWDVFDAEYPPLVQTDQEITCYALQNRLRLADLGALEEARPLWFAAAELPDSCIPLMEQLIADKRLGTDDIWERMRRLLEAKKLGAAKVTAAYLPASQAPAAKTLDAIADKPLRHLALLPPNFASSRQGREMALFAVQRTARSDPLQAAQQWEGIKDKFSAADRGYIYGQLGWQGALRHLPESVGWYALAGNAPLSDEQAAWKARAALRGQNWAVVHAAIEQMPPAMQAQPDWIYWLGRAHEALGRQEEARALYRRIAGQPNFYGNLADDELGRPIMPPPLPQKPASEEVKAVAALPGIRRAMALFRTDMRIEGIREWNWTVRGMDDAKLLAAAEFANRNEIFDRAINTADRTLAQHDYSMRYLSPFREHVEPKAQGAAARPGLGLRPDAAGEPLHHQRQVGRRRERADAAHAEDGQLGGEEDRPEGFPSRQDQRYRHERHARHQLPEDGARRTGQPSGAGVRRLQRRAGPGAQVARREADRGRHLRRDDSLQRDARLRQEGDEQRGVLLGPVRRPAAVAEDAARHHRAEERRQRRAEDRRPTLTA